MNEDMEKMLQEAPAPTLTLEPFTEEKEEPAVVEKEEAVQPVDEKEKIKAILTPQEQKQVDAFVKQIDITNSQMVLQYGASSQKKIADFSESALGNVRTKDLGEIGNELTAVVNELKSIEDGDEEKGFLGLFKKGGNKIANMKAKYGLDKPFIEQYGTYMRNYMHGDFGISFMKKGITTNDIISAGFPYSLAIGIWASLVILGFGIFFGIIAALRQNKFVDRVLMVLSTLGATIPSFVFATGFLYLFSKILGWVPSFGVNSWKGYIGPVIVSALFSLAYVVRLTRTSTLDVLNQDYIRTARAKGLPEWKVLGKHALRNALLPVVTYIGPMFAALITGSFVVEKVFGIPGIGNLFTNSILNRDYTLIMGITVFFSVILVICILVVDILYVLIDPRIKYQ